MKITDVPYEPDTVVYLILEQDTSTGRDVRLAGWTLSAHEARWWVGRQGMLVFTACPYFNIMPDEQAKAGGSRCTTPESRKTTGTQKPSRPRSLAATCASWVRRFLSGASSRPPRSARQARV